MPRRLTVALLALAPLAAAPAAPAAVDLRFGALPAVATADNPRQPIVADVDGDGLVDVLVPAFSAGQVTVLKGNGDGTLGERHDYPAGPAPSAIAASADLRHGLGRVDVVVASAQDGWSYLDNDGSGAFLKRGAAGSSTYGGGIPALDVAVVHAAPPLADVVLSVVASAIGAGGGGIVSAHNTCVLPGPSCPGLFDQPWAIPIQTGASPYQMDVRQLDDGSWQGVVVDTHTNTVRRAILGGVTVWLPQADVLDPPGTPWDVAFIDVVPGGQLDVLVPDLQGVNLFRKTATGYDRTVVTTTCVDPQTVVVGDIDRDRREDFAVVCANGTADATVQIYLGLGDGRFRAGPVLAGANFRDIALGDLDGDRALDVIAASRGGDSVSVFRSTAAPSASPARLAFGERDALSTSPASVVAVGNRGAGDAVLNDAAITGADDASFELVDNGCIGGTGSPTPLGPADACPIQVAFSPRALGPASATLVLTFARGGPVRVPLTGIGVLPGAPRLTDVRAGAAAKRRGALVRLELSRSARITATLTRKNGKRWKTLASVTRQKGPGATSITLGPKLTAGRYRVRLVAVDARGRKSTKIAAFRLRKA